MTEATPAHVRDVEQTVEAVQVNERTEVRDVFDNTLADVARNHLGEQLRALVAAFGFDEFAAGEHDVLALLIDFDDLEFVGVAHERGEILRRDDVELRRRQKRFDADIDDESAFDHRGDFAHDAAAFVANRKDAIPVLFELRLLVREDDGAFLVFELLNQHVDLLADDDCAGFQKFVERDDAFAFVADVHEDFFGADFDDGAFDDFALGDHLFTALFQSLFHGEHNFTVN